MTEPRVDLSVVIPVYFNEGTLRSTTENLLRDVIEPRGLTAEIVFVDDGSGDGSLEELFEVQREHPELVRIIRLTRNFGQPAARLAGLRHARGERIVSMSADGQDPTTVVSEMLDVMRDEDRDLVIGTRAGRDESWYRRWTSAFFYRLMRYLSFPEMPSGGFDLVLLTRRVLDVILDTQEAQPFFQGQLLWTGYEPRFHPYQRQARKVGRSRWTFRKKLTLLIDAVLNYSFSPIRAISLFGILFASLGFLFAGIVSVRWLLYGTNVPGWATIICTVLLLGGVQMLMLGVIGEYLWRTLAQVRGRPLYVIRGVYDEPVSDEDSERREPVPAATSDVTG